MIYKKNDDDSRVDDIQYNWIEIETKKLKHNEIEVDWVIYRKVLKLSSLFF